MRSRLTVGAVAMAVAIAGCGGWTQQNFDAGRSRGNEFERGLTVANAPTLVHHTLAGTVVAVLGNTIVMQQGSDVVAYDAATCPHADNGPCTPLWTRSNTTWEAATALTSSSTDRAGRPSKSPT